MSEMKQRREVKETRVFLDYNDGQDQLELEKFADGDVVVTATCGYDDEKEVQVCISAEHIAHICRWLQKPFE